jgi:GNAT superfamily N-acetyltransferase
MKILIRNVDPNKKGTATTLTYLQKKCLPYDQPYDTSQGWWWIAYDQGKPVAFAGLVRSISWGDCGYLCRAGVISLYRGKGIQKKLIAVRAKKAKKLGYKWLVSDTRDNHPSANSLAKAGFRMFTPTNPWGYNDTLYWRKRLDAIQRPASKKSKTKNILKNVLRKKQAKRY